MATVKGVNRTLADTPTGSNIVAPGLMKGKLRVMTDSYEASAIAAGTVIEVGDLLPKGVKVVDVMLMGDDLSADVTLAVGDYEDADRYITATVFTTANQVTHLNAIDGLFYEVDETYTGKTVGSGTDRQLTITTAVSACTGTIKVAVLYVQE